MCTICTEHGHGEKWYLNFENYLIDKVYPTPEDKEAVKLRHRKALRDTDRYGDPGYMHDASYLQEKYRTCPGQVITAEEANTVMELAGEAIEREDTMLAIAKCNCAMTYRGELDYRCIVFGYPVSWSMEIGYARFPNKGLTEFGGAQWSELRSNLRRAGQSTIDIAEVKDLLADWARKGLVHTLVSRGILPLIDGICNCDTPHCMRMRHRGVLGITDNCLVKGHYVARVVPDRCNSCGLCKIKCPFNAVTVSKYSGLTSIDVTKCYGCGICRTACKKDAVEIVAREAIPAAANLW